MQLNNISLYFNTLNMKPTTYYGHNHGESTISQLWLPAINQVAFFNSHPNELPHPDCIVAVWHIKAKKDNIN
jgi:hypothetical protein